MKMNGRNSFVLPWKFTKDHKLIEFQYKILHKVFASQSYVSRFDRNVPELCTKCNVRDNTIHMFFKCDEVKHFWNDFVHFFRDFIPSQTIELEHVIFGLLETDCETINYCVLHAKCFLYIQYMSDSANFSGACNVRNYCGYLKNIVKIEKECNVLGHRYDELLSVLERN